MQSQKNSVNSLISLWVEFYSKMPDEDKNRLPFAAECNKMIRLKIPDIKVGTCSRYSIAKDLPTLFAAKK